MGTKMDIWVLTCGGFPHTWHEDVFVLLKQIQETFPEQRWEQINPFVWEQINGLWRLTKISKQKQG